MKKLFLLRHAKSSWSNPGLKDRARPLNRRGLKNAPCMGRRLKSRHQSLDLVLTSPALRATTTAELFVEASGHSSDIITEEPRLYFSGIQSIENIIRQQDNRVQSLLLVFHNPDITHFANTIDSSEYFTNVPTCGLLQLNCPIKHWADWSASNCQLDYYDYPKKILP